MARTEKPPKMKWRKSDKMDSFDVPSKGKLIGSFLITCLIIVCILYVAAHVIVRTHGVRALLCEQVEERLGVPVSVDSLSLAWNLDLRVAGLRSEEDIKPGRPGFAVLEGCVHWAPSALARRGQPWVEAVDLVGLRLSLAEEEDGHWEPKAFAAGAEWVAQVSGLQVGGVDDDEDDKKEEGEEELVSLAKKKASRKASKPESKENVWQNVRISVENGEITWWDAAGTRVAAAQDVDVTATPVKVPGRKMGHFRVKMGHAEGHALGSVENLATEIVSTRGHHVILGLQGDWRRGAAAKVRAQTRETEPKRPVKIAIKRPERPVRREEPEVKTVAAPAPALEEEAEIEPVVVDADGDELVAYIREVLSEAINEQ